MASFDDPRGTAPAGGDRLRAAGREFVLTHHAALQMRQRGVSVGRVEHLLENAAVVLEYYHDFEWKTAYYDRRTRTFVALAGGSIVTVVDQVPLDYVRRLRGLRP